MPKTKKRDTTVGLEIKKLVHGVPEKKILKYP